MFRYCRTITWFLRGVDEDNTIGIMKDKKNWLTWLKVDEIAWMQEAWVQCPQQTLCRMMKRRMNYHKCDIYQSVYTYQGPIT